MLALPFHISPIPGHIWMKTGSRSGCTRKYAKGMYGKICEGNVQAKRMRLHPPIEPTNL